MGYKKRMSRAERNVAALAAASAAGTTTTTTNWQLIGYKEGQKERQTEIPTYVRTYVRTYGEGKEKEKRTIKTKANGFRCALFARAKERTNDRYSNSSSRNAILLVPSSFPFFQC